MPNKCILPEKFAERKHGDNNNDNSHASAMKSIDPGLTIQDMLEIKNDLTLPQLKSILKGHFKEDCTANQ